MPMRNLTTARLDGVLQVSLFVTAGTGVCLLLSLAAHHLLALVMRGGASEFLLAAAIVDTVLIAAPLLTWLGLRQRELSRLKHRFAKAISSDSLTECLNAPTFSGLVDAYSTGLQDSAPTGALVLVDVDGFEVLNERFGRRYGDQALRLIADAVQRSVRNGDLVGRIGDDMFAIFLPGASRENAASVAERIRTAVASIDFAPSGTKHTLTVSGGAILFEGEVEFDTLFKIADRQLRHTRSEGTNRIGFTRFQTGPAATPPTRH